MSKIDDRLAASMKPGQGKGKTTGANKPGTAKKTAPAVIIPQPVSAPMVDPLPIALPNDRVAQPRQTHAETPDVNSQSRPLHPRRIWPD